MSAIRVLLVDDQALFREGLKTLLSLQPDLEVVGEAGDGEEALQLAGKTHPDVVLMDLQMPILNGVEATRRLLALHPECRVLALTTFEDDDSIFDALRAGALGYLLKDVPSAQLLEAIRAAARGEASLHPSVATRVVAQFTRLANQSPTRRQALAEPLTGREIEVLQLMATGASNREIAAKLVIAEGTVKNHVTSILAKLEVADRTQAALKARDLGLL